MTDIIQTFNESGYTLILVSNFLPGFMLFEIIEATTLMKFSTEFKLIFASVAGLLLTEWFYESISIFYNFYTFLKNDRDVYKRFLTIMSPIRMLRRIANIKEFKQFKEIQKSSYPQSMAYNTAIGSTGWLLIFFALVTWLGLFYIMFGVTILIAVKTFIKFLCEDELKRIKSYIWFQYILLIFIGIIILRMHRQESEIIFMPSQNYNISISIIYVLIIGSCFILNASVYYLNNIKHVLCDLENSVPKSSEESKNLDDSVPKSSEESKNLDDSVPKSSEESENLDDSVPKSSVMAS
jgi:hypothetical protein